jgi:hypothetical protein
MYYGVSSMSDKREVSYQVILQAIVAAAREAALEAVGSGDPNAEAQVFAYYDILDVAKEQAELLEVPLADIGLADFDPDVLLPGRRRPAA